MLASMAEREESRRKARVKSEELEVDADSHCDIAFPTSTLHFCDEFIIGELRDVVLHGNFDLWFWLWRCLRDGAARRELFRRLESFNVFWICPIIAASTLMFLDAAVEVLYSDSLTSCRDAVECG